MDNDMVIKNIGDEEPECADILPAGTERCVELKNDGRCEQWKFVQENCMATCGLCKLSV